MSVHYGAFRNLQANLQLNRGDTLQFKSVTGHYVPVRVQTFVQTTAPVAVAGSDLVPTVVLNAGDVWIDSSTVAREGYTWNGSAWVKNAIPSAGVNIKNSDGVTPLSQLSNLNPNLGNITTGNIVSTVLDGGFNYSLWLNETATNTDVIAAGLSSLGKGSVPFRVSRTGVLYASGATISGAITATSGAIGGWTINSAYLAKDTGVDAASAGLAPLDFPFYAGATYANRASAPYRVTPAGALYASSANITGAITASSGSVGSFTIGTYLYSGSKTAYNDGLAGVHLGSDGIGLNNNFWVSAAGVLAASSGTIGGWALDTNMLRSTGIGTARIELDQSAARISVKDATNASKTVMGYLNGLAKHDGTGNWGAGDYGFWAAAGDHLKIDGDARYKSGDWIVENDGSFLVQNASNTTIVRLGTLTGVKGLYLYDSTPTLLAKFATDGIYLGTAGGAANSLAYTVGGGLNIQGAITADTGYIGGTGGWTITAGKWYGGSGAAFSGSIQGTGATKSFFAGATDNAGTGAAYYVTAAGALYASSATISGAMTSSSFSTAASGKRVDISVTTPNEITFYGDRGDTVIESLATIGISTGLDPVIGLFGSVASTRIALKALSDSNVAMHGYSAQSYGVVGESAGLVAGVRGIGNNVGVEGYSAGGLSGKFTCNVNWGGIYLVPYNGTPGGTAEGQLSADNLSHSLKYRDNSAWRTLLWNGYTGNVGFGTASPIAKVMIGDAGAGSHALLHIAEPTGGATYGFLYRMSNTTGVLEFNRLHVGVEYPCMVFDRPSGNVGVGTPAITPASKLEVDGTVTVGRTATGAAVTGLSGTYFGYSNGYRGVMLGAVGNPIFLGVSPTSNSSSAFTGNEIVIPNNIPIISPNAANNGYVTALSVNSSNQVSIGAGALLVAPGSSVAVINSLGVGGMVTTADRFRSTTSAGGSTFSATAMDLLCHSTYGAILQGYGASYDVCLFNRAGSLALTVAANSTLIGIPGPLGVSGLATFSVSIAQPVQRYTGGTGTVTASAGVRTLLLDTNLGAGALTIAFPTATADGQEFTITSWYTLTNVTLSAAGTNLANSGITTLSQGRAATWTWLAATSSWFYAGGQ